MERATTISLSSVASYTLQPAMAFEPVPRPPLDRLEQGIPSGRPCNDNWKLLYQCYAAPYADMNYPEFRDLSSGCRIEHGRGPFDYANRQRGAGCTAYRGPGIHAGGRLDYGWRGWRQVKFSHLGNEDIDCAVQLACIFPPRPTRSS